jgi:translation initiation factor 2B subunit (eIF-2B alpha/beta/delta family)
VTPGQAAADPAEALLTDLERWTAMDRSPSAADARTELLVRLRMQQIAHPASGLVHQLATRMLIVADAAVIRGDSPVDLRAAVSRACAAERQDLESMRAGVARVAASLITEREGWIATVGDDPSLRRALSEARKAGREPRVIAAEGRPTLVGRDLAAALAAERTPVWLVADAALPMLLAPAQMLWFAALAVTDRGAIAPLGAFAAALAAREHSVPAYALAGRRAFLPATTAALRIVERDPEELWDAPPSGVRARNIHEELVPLALLRAVVVEDAALGPLESAQLAREREVPVELAVSPA